MEKGNNSIRVDHTLRVFVGPRLTRPSLSGWFSRMSEDGKTAPYYSSIEEVAAARLAVFLTRHDVPAYIMAEDGENAHPVLRTVRKPVQGFF